jgi:hypothetical protein
MVQERAESLVPKTDYEFLFGFLFMPLLAGVFLLILRLSSYFPLFCVFHRLTGIPCPACGSFRCEEQLMAGHLRDAFLVQPLMTLIVLGCVAFALYSWVVVIFQLPRLRLEGVTRRQRRAVIWMAITLVVANWFYLLMRG